MTDVVVFGLGKLAELAHFYFTHDSDYRVVAFTSDDGGIYGGRFIGLPVVPFDKVEEHYPPDKFKMFVAIGYTQLNTTRAEKYYVAKKKGYELVSYICSKATYWDDLSMGDNCFILENQVIQPTVKIGNNVIIWSGNHFGHNVVIGDHCYISSHVVLCGGVKVGPYSFIGVNATVRDEVIIGEKCVIGAGALILGDAPDKAVYVAKPTEIYRLDSASFERMMGISK